MALKIERQITTSESIKDQPRTCWTCGLKRVGLFGVDVYNRPTCAGCMKAMGRPLA